MVGEVDAHDLAINGLGGVGGCFAGPETGWGDLQQNITCYKITII